MDRRVTPPKRVTSPTWGPPPPCKQALKRETRHFHVVVVEKGEKCTKQRCDASAKLLFFPNPIVL